MYRTVQRLTPEQVEVVARQLYIEMLKGGYTQWPNSTTCITTPTVSLTSIAVK